MKEVRTEDRIDEAVLYAPNTPIAASVPNGQSLVADEDTRKGRSDIVRETNQKDYRED